MVLLTFRGAVTGDCFVGGGGFEICFSCKIQVGLELVWHQYDLGGKQATVTINYFP